MCGCTACPSRSMQAAMCGLLQERKWHMFREFVSKLYLRVPVMSCLSLVCSLHMCVHVCMWTTQSLWGHNNNRSTSFQWYGSCSTRGAVEGNKLYQSTSQEQQPHCLVDLSHNCVESYSPSQFLYLLLQTHKYTVTALYLVWDVWCSWKASTWLSVLVHLQTDVQVWCCVSSSF